MTERHTHGRTKSGKPITDTDVEKLAAEAEAGYDVDALIARRNKRGRPTIGSAAASVESSDSTQSCGASSSSARTRRERRRQS